jgi:hypothetical protein
MTAISADRSLLYRVDVTEPALHRLAARQLVAQGATVVLNQSVFKLKMSLSLPVSLDLDGRL